MLSSVNLSRWEIFHYEKKYNLLKLNLDTKIEIKF